MARRRRRRPWFWCSHARNGERGEEVEVGGGVTSRGLLLELEELLGVDEDMLVKLWGHEEGWRGGEKCDFVETQRRRL